VDRIDGISPAVAIEQRNPTTSSRSTVGTATEVYDYLRLLWARVGRQFCHRCGARVVVDSPTTAADRVLAEANGQAAVIAFAPPVSESPSHDLLLENLRAMGFIRVMLGDVVHRLDELPADARLDQPGLLVVVDRIPIEDTNRTRICDSIAAAFAEGEGTAEVLWGAGRLRVSQHPRCTSCGTPAPRLSPTLFSFNSPSGACPACNGFGAILEYDESLIVCHPDRSLAQGALDPWTKPRYDGRRRLLKEVARREGIPFEVAWKKLKPAQQRLLLHGKSARFIGIFPFLRALEEKRYKQYIRVFLRQYQLAIECPECHGARLRPEALAVRIGERTIAEVSGYTAELLERWLNTLDLTSFERGVAETILRELTARTTFLCDVGLKYLTLDRQTRSLSGGEAQRIALANALGSSLVDTLYVLDEPSIGLHPRDVGRLLDLLRRLRSAGNTVVMVEHDLAAMRASDYVIELGPGSGEHGGQVVYAGPLSGVEGAGTLTADYLNGKKRIAIPSGRRRAGPLWLSVKGAKLHNLQGVDVAFPLSTLTVVTGVSGSGKSTLVHDVLYRQLAARIKGKHGAKEHLGEPVGEVQALTGWELLEDVVLVDQSPIGRSPRSNPITYIKAFDAIRDLYAQQPLSRARNYTPTTFSFNAVDGGRCPVCEGAGHILVEMVFLADIFVPCEACGGTRFKREVLDVRIKGLTIADTLELTVDEAIRRFRHQDRLGKALWHLQQVGLGYLRLGQPATTLSGGEAQRLKIARQLAIAGRGTGRKLYILDEPTTGLHLEDVRTLLKVLDRLVDAGHTVVVIEHHLDVIKRADWVIDLGPEGGDEGGRVVVAGTPEEVARADSHTAHYLRIMLEEPKESAAVESA
jgi:excinuclease ABC subunit A